MMYELVYAYFILLHTRGSYELVKCMNKSSYIK